MGIDPLSITPRFTYVSPWSDEKWGILAHGCPYCGKWNNVSISMSMFIKPNVCEYCKEGYEIYKGYQTESNPGSYYSCKRGLTAIKKFYTWKPRIGKWIKKEKKNE